MENDFSKGSVVRHMINLVVPMTMAQLINVLYNVVDRMYIGRIPEHATLSLTGLCVTLPIISIVMAFANLFGMGGAPLCSIARGHGDKNEAENINNWLKENAHKTTPNITLLDTTYKTSKEAGDMIHRWIMDKLVI